MAKTSTSLLIAALVSLGCGRTPPGYVVKTPAHEVRIETSPSPIPLNEHFELIVTVAGAPASGIAVDATMPKHKHGMNTDAQVEPLGGGRYRVKGMLFHMPGDWELVVSVLDASGKKDRVMLPIHLD